MSESTTGAEKSVLLLISPQSYRGTAFVAAAERRGLIVHQGIDLPPALASEWNVPLGIDFSQPERSAEQIVEFARTLDQPIDAIISVDDAASLLAAVASRRLGIPHNSPEAALAARDKFRMRELLAAGGVEVPEYRLVPAASDPEDLAGEVTFPCVVKPTLLSGSRGVIRANDRAEFVAAFRRTVGVIEGEGASVERSHILIEEYLPGVEVAVEGLLDHDKLHVLAIFDKPDPLTGPFFEETIYTTPSRLSEETQVAIADCTARGAHALGLREGPIHAELRVNDRGPWIIEIAGRSIGGLCSTILEFGTGMALEDLILSQAVGLDVSDIDRGTDAAGVMMIPIPRTGILREVSGIDEAEKVEHITGIEITAKVNHPLQALPEGASYLGFIFAKAKTPDVVEAALRGAHSQLNIRITPQINLIASGMPGQLR